jgi:hypothetical protein
MRYTTWMLSIYESVDDLQALWRMFCTVSSIPLPMVLFIALSGCLFLHRHRQFTPVLITRGDQISLPSRKLMRCGYRGTTPWVTGLHYITPHRL